MLRTVLFHIGLVSLLLLPGCGLFSSHAVIVDLESDKAIIQLSGSDFSIADVEAKRGCGIHGKYAQKVSHFCVDKSCGTKSVLYACKEGKEGSVLRDQAIQETISQERSPHTRNSGPPKATPLSWSDRAMREGLR